MCQPDYQKRYAAAVLLAFVLLCIPALSAGSRPDKTGSSPLFTLLLGAPGGASTILLPIAHTQINAPRADKDKAGPAAERSEGSLVVVCARCEDRGAMGTVIIDFVRSERLVGKKMVGQFR